MGQLAESDAVLTREQVINAAATVSVPIPAPMRSMVLTTLDADIKFGVQTQSMLDAGLPPAPTNIVLPPNVVYPVYLRVAELRILNGGAGTANVSIMMLR